MHPKIRKSLPARIAAWAFIGLILVANIMVLSIFGVQVPSGLLLGAFYLLSAVAIVAGIGCLFVWYSVSREEAEDEGAQPSEADRQDTPGG